MNRILCYLNAGCQHSHYLRWIDRVKRVIEQVETAADLEEGFEFCTPSLSSLLEGDKDRQVRLYFWCDGTDIDDIDNLPSIAAGIFRKYADSLLAAAARIDDFGKGVTL